MISIDIKVSRSKVKPILHMLGKWEALVFYKHLYFYFVQPTADCIVEECKHCGEKVPIVSLRSHITDCQNLEVSKAFNIKRNVDRKGSFSFNF